MKNGILGACMAIVLAGQCAAEATPPSSRLDSRVRVSRYIDGQVFVLRTGMTRATTVEFEEGEKIVSIVAGDTESFHFDSIPGDRVFAVKPTQENVRSNVTVYTNRRSYYFTIHEANNPFYVLRFSYPERERNQAGQPVRRMQTNRSYGVSERNDIAPIAIWDDGAFTYFRFLEDAPIPAIFKVSDGRERSVNSATIESRTVRVSGTSQQWALRLGQTEVCVAEIMP